MIYVLILLRKTILFVLREISFVLDELILSRFFLEYLRIKTFAFCIHKPYEKHIKRENTLKNARW